MSKQGWIAVFLAIIFPTTALIVIMLARPGNQKTPQLPPPGAGGCPAGFHAGPGHHGPKIGHHGGSGHHGPKMGRHNDRMKEKDGHLKMMARDLGLSKEQIEKIIDVESKARTTREKLRLSMDNKHQELSELMKKGAADEAAAMKIIDEIVKMKSEMDRSHLTMPFEIRKIMTPEQRKKMEKILSEKHSPAIPHKGPMMHGFPGGPGVPMIPHFPGAPGGPMIHTGPGGPVGPMMRGAFGSPGSGMHGSMMHGGGGGGGPMNPQFAY
ncbi:Spy/CpxP family protein refolding chaperone [Myxococcota bacterium]|nr:Spy/CpxP family protein refolding chaperone [Myxococcota bacterium]MBU1380335.1 Spy/CpxP family protein refolding chaperone [Myxococcota bacterium]MBU1497168.1 Spy/CpxP family protein refolding chaperone [Myxococcota bacterium]